MGINGVNIPPNSYVWEQVGAQWIVNNAATVSTPETMNLTSVPVSVVWNSQVNGPTAWGYFDVAQTGAAQPVGVSTIEYATGSAAKILGLSEGSPGYPGILYSGAFASSPGNAVRDIGAWLHHFRASVDSSWTSCEIDYPSAGVPDSLSDEIQDWATKHPPIQCPASWVTTPPSTPSLLSCIHHEPSWPPQRRVLSVSSIVNAVEQSTCADTINGNQVPYWDDTAIFVKWDDWRGWYDYEPPRIEAYPQGATRWDSVCR